MRIRNSKLNVAVTISVVACLVLVTAAPVTLANNDCRTDQRQLQNQGAIQFGGRIVLGQTFVPSVAGRQVCRVKVQIRKNMAGAGDLKLHLVRSNLADMDAAVTIPGGAIPMGDSVQLFDFGCNGAVLVGQPFYGLKLESPGSVFGAYSWKGVAGDVYVKPGNGGRGWRNANSGTGHWTNLGGWDYAFEIYLCD